MGPKEGFGFCCRIFSFVEGKAVCADKGCLWNLLQMPLLTTAWIITYLAPLGTRSTKRTLEIRERCRWAQTVSSLWIPAVVRLSARSQHQSLPSKRVQISLTLHRNKKGFKHPASSVTLSTAPGLCCGTISQPGMRGGAWIYSWYKTDKNIFIPQGQKAKIFFQGLIRLSVFLGFGIRCSWFKDSWNNMAIGINYI